MIQLFETKLIISKASTGRRCRRLRILLLRNAHIANYHTSAIPLSVPQISITSRAERDGSDTT